MHRSKPRILAPPVLIGLLMFCIGLLALVHSIAVGAAAPAPNLSISKTATAAHDPANPGDVIAFTITVVNSGDADSSQVHVTDTLPPAGGVWQISAVTNSLGCVLSGSGNTQLTCDVGNVPHRHLNESASAFVNGSASVTVLNTAGACGSLYVNYSALLTTPYTAISSNSAAIEVAACPTPVPTATTPPPTAAPSTPTAAPTDTSTPTPTTVRSTSTPRPPQTGSDPLTADGNGMLRIAIGLLISAILVMALFTAFALYDRREHLNDSNSFERRE